jgi:uncharacterized membrane protein
MKKLSEKKYIKKAFEFGIILKGIDAVIEIISSFLILFVTKSYVMHLALLVVNNELLEDPKDFIANYILGAAQHLSVSTQVFAFIYLLSHGVIKLFLIIGLLKNKFWAYKASLIVFTLFILYQIYRYTHTHSVWLVLLTVFDLVVLWLIYREYKYVKLERVG